MTDGIAEDRDTVSLTRAQHEWLSTDATGNGISLSEQLRRVLDVPLKDARPDLSDTGFGGQDFRRAMDELPPCSAGPLPATDAAIYARWVRVAGGYALKAVVTVAHGLPSPVLGHVASLDDGYVCDYVPEGHNQILGPKSWPAVDLADAKVSVERAWAAAHPGVELIVEHKRVLPT